MWLVEWCLAHWIISLDRSPPDDLERLETHFLRSQIGYWFAGTGEQSNFGQAFVACPQVCGGYQSPHVAPASCFGSDEWGLETTVPRGIKVTGVFLNEATEHAIEPTVLSVNDKHA